MVFLASKELSSGMRLARDIHYYDLSKKQIVEIKKSYILNSNDIWSIRNSNIDGLYVDKAADTLSVEKIITDELKNEAIEGITTIAESFLANTVNKKQFEEIDTTALKLIESLTSDNITMVNIFDLKKYDDYTFHHSLSVAVMSLAMGIELKLNEIQLKELVLSALLHDIGKVSVPIEILNKPSRLTPEEFNIVKKHPLDAGKYLLGNNLITENTFRGIVCHHEKWDGTGYPNRLSKDNIPFYSRIITVADVYDALTSTRPYRKPSEPTEAVEYIMGGTGTYFDQDMVKVFLKKIAPYPVGCKVKLSNGREAAVIKNNPSQPLRPVVSMIDSSDIYDLYNDFSTLNIVITGTIK